MNEQIKELAKQAGFRVFGDVIVAADQGSSGLATECTQRLVELVVKECANIAFAQANHYAETQNKGSAMSAADCVGRLIKLEFGIK